MWVCALNKEVRCVNLNRSKTQIGGAKIENGVRKVKRLASSKKLVCLKINVGGAQEKTTRT